MTGLPTGRGPLAASQLAWCVSDPVMACPPPPRGETTPWMLSVAKGVGLGAVGSYVNVLCSLPGSTRGEERCTGPSACPLGEKQLVSLNQMTSNSPQ